MRRFPLLALGLACLFSTACGDDAQPTTPAASAAACPPDKEVNKFGIGRPCSTSTDCKPPHGFCWKEKDPVHGLGICVMPAFVPENAGWPACGFGARRIPDPSGDTAKPALCVPNACADKLFQWPYQPQIYYNCDKNEVNSKGVGKPCKNMSDCAEFGSSFACPVVVHDDPNFLDFCSPLCGQDSDCGEKALCVWHIGKAFEPQDMYPHASCVPTSCCVYPGCPKERKGPQSPTP